MTSRLAARLLPAKTALAAVSVQLMPPGDHTFADTGSDAFVMLAGEYPQTVGASFPPFRCPF